MSPPEFSRLADARVIDAKPLKLVAHEVERAALAKRFGLVSVDRLEAEIHLVPDNGGVLATGTLWAEIVQSCAVSGDDLPIQIEEDVRVRFVPAREIEEDELELEEGDCDEIPYEGERFDIGEAIAQSLALAIDPYATGPEADRVRQEKGLLDESASGPFAALAALKKD